MLQNDEFDLQRNFISTAADFSDMRSVVRMRKFIHRLCILERKHDILQLSFLKKSKYAQKEAKTTLFFENNEISRKKPCKKTGKI